MTTYNPQEIEKKWQAKWEKDRLYVADVSRAKQPFYNLWMFPYPSAEGLHAGHAFASTGSDIYGRFMRMQGKDIFQPIGYDSFGIHSENFAIKIGDHPKTLIERASKNYERQFKSMGHAYDWTRTVTTSDVDYYRWTQWLFVQMYKAGLAYKKKAWVNWCPGCKTVIADEQIMTPAAAGKWPKQYITQEDVPEGMRVCERCGSEPEKKELSQWFFRITKYADRLLKGLEKID
ncbi:MAG: class I tRNA ligase family protein, partial [bacterium]|nr:class I tRNA ligase family protein [bacterium]